jgi:Uri superfamily endonuclease
LKGVYVLTISVNKDAVIKVGSLGKIVFQKGLYVYVGSAQSNLEERIKRHLRKTKKRFWHIDYLLCKRFVKVETVLYKAVGKSEECEIARSLSRDGGIPIKNFGCSDCDCVSHLFMLKD